MTSYELFIVIHTINGQVHETYSSTIREMLINKLPKDVISAADCRDLLHYGSHKEHIGGEKHCFYFNIINTI